jgi:O-antigen/teichoic acid export membrane protein
LKKLEFSYEEEIAKKSVESLGWNYYAVIIKVFLNFFRIYFLARLISEEAFGVYGYVNSIFLVLMSFRYFGTNSAVINRSKYSKNSEIALENYFSLNIILTIVWILICIIVGIILIDFNDPIERITFFILLILNVSVIFYSPTKIKLLREIKNKLLAKISILQSFMELFLSVGFAYYGFGIFALLATNFSVILSNVVVFTFLGNGWKLKWSWDWAKIKHYLKFGKSISISNIIESLLDRVDDMWVKIFLGNYVAGLYTMSHNLSRFPYRILSGPLNSVMAGSFSALEKSPKFLNDAFQKSNALIFRLGFFVSGGLIAISDEFILVMLGEKWLPMKGIFVYLIIYTLFKPVLAVYRNYFVAIGTPDEIFRNNLFQLIVLFSSMFILGNMYKVIGIAISVNIATIAGIIFLQIRCRKFISINWKEALVLPASIAIISFLATYLPDLSFIGDNDIWIGVGKVSIYLGIYLVFTLIFDRKQIFELQRLVKKYLIK